MCGNSGAAVVLALSSWVECRSGRQQGSSVRFPGATGVSAIFLPEIRLRQVFLRISPYPQKNAFLRKTLAIPNVLFSIGNILSKI